MRDSEANIWRSRTYSTFCHFLSEMLISFTCLSVVFFAKLSKGSFELPPDGPFAVEIGEDDGQIVSYHRNQSLKRIVSASGHDQSHSVRSSASSWMFSFDKDGRSLTFSSTAEGGLKVTVNRFKILGCDGVESSVHDEPCILRSSTNTPLLSPYYGFVKTRNIVEGGPMRQKKAPIRYFLLFDLHLLRAADTGVPASTPSDESEAFKALHRAINQTMKNATKGWLDLTPDKTHSREDAAIRAFVEAATEKSRKTSLLDGILGNRRLLSSELRKATTDVETLRTASGNDSRAKTALVAAKARAKAIYEQVRHSGREEDKAFQQLQTARLAYDSASLSLESLFTDTPSAVFAARFWAELALLRKATYAVLVVTDDKVEVKLGRSEGEVKDRDVTFWWESGRINVVGPYTDQSKLEYEPGEIDEGDDPILSSPIVSRRNGIFPTFSYGGLVELRHFAPLAPSTTSFLVFTLGKDIRILETAIRYVLGSIGANRAIRAKLSDASQRGRTELVEIHKHLKEMKLPLINDDRFYRSLRHEDESQELDIERTD